MAQTKDSLRRLVCSEQWLDWKGSQTEGGRLITQYILDTQFWIDASALQNAIAPLYFVLRLFDNEGSTMSLLYHYMLKLKKSMTETKALEPRR